jgi:hypothetical protein
MFQTVMVKALNRSGFDSNVVENPLVRFAGHEVFPGGNRSPNADRSVFCRAASGRFAISSRVLLSRTPFVTTTPDSFIVDHEALNARVNTLDTASLFVGTAKCRALSCECDRHFHNCPRRETASGNLDGRHKHGHL